MKEERLEKMLAAIGAHAVELAYEGQANQDHIIYLG